MVLNLEVPREPRYSLVNGSVKYFDGWPVVGATVRLGDQTVETDASGLFTVGDVVYGTYLLTVSIDDVEQYSEEVVLQEEETVLDIVVVEEVPQTVNLLTPNMASVETNMTGFNPSGATLSVDSTRRLDGFQSLHVVGTGAWQGTWLSSTFVPYNRGTYTFSVYAYGPAGTKLWVLIEEKNNQGTSAQKKHTASYTLAGDGWERLSVTGTLEAADSVGLSVQSDIPFEVWLDQFQLELGSDPTPWQMPVVTKNLLTLNQATLEINTLGFLSATGGGSAPDVSIDGSTAWEGESSLKISGDGSAIGQGVWTWPAFVPNDRGTYTLSVYLKGTPGDQFYLVLEEKDAKGTGGVGVVETGEPFTLTSSDWERFSLTTTMSKGQTLGFNIRHATQSPFTVWVDGIQIEEGSTATRWVSPAKPY